MSLTPLLDGPDLREGAEPAAHHLARLGPSLLSGPELIDALDQSDLRGRGGAGFPVGRKWRSVAGRQGPRALIANGAEGEPLSFNQAGTDQLRGGMTFRSFQIVYPGKRLRLTTYTYPDGKLEQYLIAPAE